MTTLPEKICKECGKSFVPKKSSREQYCTRDHYRPCPICSNPVLVTYLSDPPRRCESCKKVKAPTMKPLPTPAPTEVAKPVEVVAVSTPTVRESSSSEITQSRLLGQEIRVRYTGKPVLGFVPDTIYNISTDKSPYGYCVYATYDVTNGRPCNLAIDLSSMISVNRYFQEV